MFKYVKYVELNMYDDVLSDFDTDNCLLLLQLSKKINLAYHAYHSCATSSKADHHAHVCTVNVSQTHVIL